MELLDLSAYAEREYVDSTILDQNTGLMWSKSDWRQGGAHTYSEAVTICEGLVRFGYHDWRVPSLWELHSIIDYSQESKIQPVFEDFGTNGRDLYWTSTSSSVYQAGTQFHYRLRSGEILPRPRTEEAFVRCVRGPGLTYANLRDNGDGTVSDTANDLMWQQEGVRSRASWAEALARCEALELASFSDWRLPSIKELWTIVETSRNPGYDPEFFPGMEPETYLSATTSSTRNASVVKGVSMGGSLYPYSTAGKTWDRRVRCVRNE